MASPETEAVPEVPEAPSDEDFTWDDFGELLDDAPTEQGDQETFTVKINGEEHQVTLEEALAGYQRQADYTAKTQQLAEYRQSMQPLENLAVALDQDPEGTVKLLAKELGVTLTPAQLAEVVDEATVDPNTTALQALTARQDRFEQQQALQTARNEIIRDLTRLQSEYGEFDADALVAFATERKILDLDAAYGAWQFYQNRQAPVDETEAITEAKRRASVVETQGGRATGNLAPGGGRKLSLKESLRAAISAHQ